MGLRITTIEKINDTEACLKIMELLKLGISKKYIRQTFDVTERELERIIDFYRK